MNRVTRLHGPRCQARYFASTCTPTYTPTCTDLPCSTCNTYSTLPTCPSYATLALYSSPKPPYSPKKTTLGKHQPNSPHHTATTHVTVISSLIHLDTLPLRLTNSPRVFTSPPARLFLIRCVAAFSSPSYTQVSLAASPVGAGRSCAGYGRSAPGGGGASGKRLGSADLGRGLWDGWAR